MEKLRGFAEKSGGRLRLIVASSDIDRLLADRKTGNPAVGGMLSLAMATRPVVFSHGGVRATCNVNRNLTNDEVRGIAGAGGVIGIGYWSGAICSTKPQDVARAIAHVRHIAGIDHVGLGSDFDGSTTTGFDASQVIAVTQALLDAGSSETDIRKVMGGNVLRVLRAGIAPL